MKLKLQLNIPADTIKPPFVVAGIILYVAFLATCHIFVLKPQIRRFAELRQKQSAMNELYLQVRATDIEQILNALQQEANYMHNARQSFEQRCLQSSDVSRLLNDLNRLALKNKLKVQSIDPLPLPSTILAKYQKKAVILRLSGNFVQLLALLEEFSRLPYWLLLDNLSIVSNQSSEESINLTVYTIMG